MRVVLGTFNDMSITDGSRKYAGTKEHLEEVINKSSYSFNNKLPILSSVPFKIDNEKVEDYHKRVMSVDKSKIIGRVSNFEILEIPQDYIFNKLILIADVNMDAKYANVNNSISMRAMISPMNVREILYGDIPCTYNISNAVSRIICWDLMDGCNICATKEDAIAELYGMEIMSGTSKTTCDVFLNKDKADIKATMDSSNTKETELPFLSPIPYEELFGHPSDIKTEDDTLAKIG